MFLYYSVYKRFSTFYNVIIYIFSDSCYFIINKLLKVIKMISILSSKITLYIKENSNIKTNKDLEKINYA